MSVCLGIPSLRQSISKTYSINVEKINSKMILHGLISKYNRPFEVVEKVGEVTYRLNLPKRLKIYPIFHLRYLRSFHEDIEDPTMSETRGAPPIMQSQFEE